MQEKMASTSGEVLFWLIALTCSCYGGQPSKHYDCLEDRTWDQLCVNPNSTSSVGCSGRGDCICGVCECHARRQHSAQKYSGRFCHCDDYSCSYHMNQLCGGHGRCECGGCMCDEGYTGEACECPLSPDTCMTSKGVICNDRGDCECGVCKCYGSYRGPTCEECPTCPGTCTENKDCVMCRAFGTGRFDAETCKERCTQRLDIVSELNEMENDVYLCQFLDAEDDCRFWFTFEYAPYGHFAKEIRVLKDKECPDTGTAAVNSRPTVTLLLGGLAVFILKQRRYINRKEFETRSLASSLSHT